MTRTGDDPSWVELRFVVSEGPRYRVRNVILHGNSDIDTEELRKDLELQSGMPFSAALRDADKNRMLFKYNKIGCIDVQIRCEPQFTNQPGVVDLVYKFEDVEPYLLSELKVRAKAQDQGQRDPRTGGRTWEGRHTPA